MAVPVSRSASMKDTHCVGLIIICPNLVSGPDGPVSGSEQLSGDKEAGFGPGCLMFHKLPNHPDKDLNAQLAEMSCYHCHSLGETLGAADRPKRSTVIMVVACSESKILLVAWMYHHM